MILFLGADDSAWIADVAQSVERRLGKAEVTGPIPVISWTEKEDGHHACMNDHLFFCPIEDNGEAPSGPICAMAMSRANAWIKR